MPDMVAVLSSTCLVGIDWASEEHAVHVMDASGRKVTAFMIAHSRDGFETVSSGMSVGGLAGWAGGSPCRRAVLALAARSLIRTRFVGRVRRRWRGSRCRPSA